MRCFAQSVFLLGLVCGAAVGPGARAADTLVVCPAPLRGALEPWVKFRQGQGHKLTFIETAATDEELRAAIREQAAKDSKLKFLVLVGDATASADDTSATVPVHGVEAKVNIHWGRGEPTIPTDNWYADLDDDQLPDLAVGRLTADSPEDLGAIVDKIMAYEQQTDFGLWRRTVDFVAGMGGFGQMADGALEMGAKRFITEGLPPAYDVHMTYGSWRSPYCPDPRAFHETAVERLNAGNLFWVYIGHGARRELDEVKVPGQEYHILGVQDIAKLKSGGGPPIAIFLACYTGGFDDARDCMAEELLRTPGAPVSILASSRVAMPYGMTVMGNELMRQVFIEKRETLGEILQQAKRGTIERPRTDEISKLLDSVAPMLNPKSKDLKAERLEHLALFNLVGDPLLRIEQPKPVTIEAPSHATAGETIVVSGRSPVAGLCTVDIVLRRDKMSFKPPQRSKYDGGGETLAGYTETYHKANDRTIVRAEVAVTKGGRFKTELALPPGIEGPCHVRAYVSGAKGFGLGAMDLEVTPAGAKEAQ